MDLLFFEFWPPLTLCLISEASYSSLSLKLDGTSACGLNPIRQSTALGTLFLFNNELQLHNHSSSRLLNGQYL
ncbi:hypothetical protein PanWU01x14_364340, partial [Parasponia andersonii]